MRTYFAVALILVLPAPAEPAPAPAGELTPAQLQNARQFLESRDPDRRSATYKASRARGEAFRETYIKLLDTAKHHHAKEFSRALDSTLDAQSAASRFIEAWQDWRTDAESARTLIQTNHEKESRKLAEIDNAFAATTRSWRLLQRALPSDSAHQSIMDRLMPHAQALHEIALELSDEDLTDDNSIGQAEVIEIERELRLGNRLSRYLNAYEAAATHVAQHREAEQTNAALRWPSKDQKAFASLLNSRRATIGLGPLTLNENLSAACAAHSKEMATLNYFSHESPVAENKTPAMRAQKARFHGFSGECIYMGSTSPEDAERAWWYSCGHRLINYASGPTILGIARHDRHWTLNTGR